MKYIIWILVGAVVFIGFSEWGSCNNKRAQTLKAEKDEMQHQRDSIAVIHKSVLASDSALKLQYRADTAKFQLVIDSLKDAYRASQIRYQDIKSQLKKTVSELSNIVDSGTDSTLIAQLNQLKDQLNSADNVVQFLQSNSSVQDSIMMAEIGYRDSVIAAKDRIINNIRSNYDGLSVLFDRANADLDIAIKQLQKGKRVRVLRTIAEAVLILGLLFKK